MVLVGIVGGIQLIVLGDDRRVHRAHLRRGEAPAPLRRQPYARPRRGEDVVRSLPTRRLHDARDQASCSWRSLADAASRALRDRGSTRRRSTRELRTFLALRHFEVLTVFPLFSGLAYATVAVAARPRRALTCSRRGIVLVGVGAILLVASCTPAAPRTRSRGDTVGSRIPRAARSAHSCAPPASGAATSSHRRRARSLAAGVRSADDDRQRPPRLEVEPGGRDRTT